MRAETPQRGYTPNELARLLRVSADRIRGWISSGRLGALNTADATCARPRFVVLPHHLAEFEQKRAAALPAKPARRQRRQAMTDYYPD